MIPVQVCKPECEEKVARTLRIMAQTIDRKLEDLDKRVKELEETHELE